MADKDIRLTAAELNALEPYKHPLDCARANYLRPVPPSAIDLMQAIHAKYTGVKYDLPRGGCGTCELGLLRVMARWVDQTIADKAQKAAVSEPSTPTPGKPSASASNAKKVTKNAKK